MLQKTIVLLLWLAMFLYSGAQSVNIAPNLAIVATPSGIDRYGGNYNELNDGMTPTERGEPSAGAQKPKRFSTWVQYDWAQPVKTDRIEVFWWDYTGTVPLPSSYHIEYWDGTRFRPVEHPTGLG